MSNEVNIGDMIYLTIPKEWIKTYHSLLYMLASVGKNIVDDCSYTCQGSGRNVFTCWNLFQSALAAKALGDDRKAQFFIDYIDKELRLYAYHSRIIIPDFSENYPRCIYKLNEDGSYTFYITCKVDEVIYNEEITIPQKDIIDTVYDKPIITGFSYNNNVSSGGNSAATVKFLTFTQRVTYKFSDESERRDVIRGDLTTDGISVVYNISNNSNNARVDSEGNVTANPAIVSEDRVICRITPQITINGQTSDNEDIYVDIIQEGKEYQPVELIGYYGVSSLSDGLPTTIDGLTNTFEAVDNLSINVTGSGNFAWIIVPNEAGINSVTCTDTDNDSVTVLKNTTNINGYTIYYVSYLYMIFENQTFIFTLSKEEQEDNTKNIFIGQCNTTITGFRELDSNTIKNYATKHKVTEGIPLGDNDIVNGVSVKDCYSFSTTIEENNRIYFVLVPTNIAIKIAKLHSTIDSYNSEDEIKNSDYWEATHSNIIIDDIEYSVYGYHNIYLAGSVITIYAKLIN